MNASMTMVIVMSNGIGRFIRVRPRVDDHLMRADANTS